jgi:hypothetical protein
MPNRDDMEQARDLVARQIIRPVIARRYSIDHIGEAHAEAEAGHLQGSVVVMASRQTTEGLVRGANLNSTCGQYREARRA